MVRRYVFYVVKNKGFEGYNFLVHSKETAISFVRRYPQKKLAVYRVVSTEREIEEVLT